MSDAVGKIAARRCAGIIAVCYEMPHDIGHVASARGDVIKLSILCGALTAFFSASIKDCMIVPVRIIDWKGQMDKEMTAKRVIREMGWNEKHGDRQTHEYDAIGIGLYKQGRL